MATELVVIGQGRLIEQSSVADFIDRHSERWVRVQSPNVATLREVLQAQGAEVAPVDETTIEVRGVTTAETGELAARHGVVLHELSPQTGSLEDAFLKATASAQEYRAGRGDDRRTAQRVDQAADDPDELGPRDHRGRRSRSIVTILVMALQRRSTRSTPTTPIGGIAGTSVVTAMLLGVIGAATITERVRVRHDPRHVRRRAAPVGRARREGDHHRASPPSSSRPSSSRRVLARCVGDRLGTRRPDRARRTSRAGAAPLVGVGRARRDRQPARLRARLAGPADTRSPWRSSSCGRSWSRAIVGACSWPQQASTSPFKFLPYQSGISMVISEGSTTVDTFGRIGGGLYFFAVTAGRRLIGAFFTRRRDA